jgi:hypothetical protein
MRLTRDPAVLLLSIWLILTGLIVLLDFQIAALPILMAILALAAGVLLLLASRRFAMGGLGRILLAAYMLAVGLVSLVGLSFSGSGIVLAVLAVAAGGFLLIGR